jgi:uncharacterized protein YeaC (DUF1315 family)
MQPGKYCVVATLDFYTQDKESCVIATVTWELKITKKGKKHTRLTVSRWVMSQAEKLVRKEAKKNGTPIARGQKPILLFLSIEPN